MGMLTQLQQNRRIVHDFTLTTLATIPCLFGRLIYFSTVRDLSSGRYEHAGLAAVYGGEAVQQALAQCHEEVFERVLETPLEAQEKDLRACLETMDGGLQTTLSHWQKLETYRVLVPERSPDYLKELFCSNLRVLLEILQAENSRLRSNE